MTLMWLVYLADVIGSLGKLSTVVVFISGIVGVISAIFYGVLLDEKNSTDEKVCVVMGKVAKSCAVICVVLSLMLVALPSKQTYYTMLAAYGVEYVATNERVVGIADQSLELLEQTIGNYLEQGEEE